MSGRVFVVGSMSADVTTFSQRLPAPGETIHGDRLSLVLGGKGANQAIAAARAGAATALIGCVGDDLFRDLVLDGLRAADVIVDGVRTVPGPTGVAHIRVDRHTGQNDIVIVAGANGALSGQDAERQLRAMGAGSGDVLLLQLEVPVTTSVHAARVAAGLGMIVVLDPAPATELPDELWPALTAVTPNESEAALLTGIPAGQPDAAKRAVRWFADRGVDHPIVTLAERGLVGVWDHQLRTLPAIPAEAVDTTAAGDAFAGALGAALASGDSWADAVLRGSAAGAYAVTVEGASPSLPTAAQVDQVLAGATRA
ncbi:ribokinase [Flexivirga meconopsidis]|uniref:ribokinase n=1 Tax=Flexivirga meconopsidis TaxID=2977121 RepID=UPI00223ED236